MRFIPRLVGESLDNLEREVTQVMEAISFSFDDFVQLE